MDAGSQYRGLPADHFASLVAGEHGERRVHRDDVVVCIGDDDAFAGNLENRFGDPQGLFRLDQFGDVGKGQHGGRTARLGR